MAIETPTVELNNGNKMPQVGFGLWKVDNATCADTVYNAIKTGYRLFDGACGMLQSFSFLKGRVKILEEIFHNVKVESGYCGIEKLNQEMHQLAVG